MQSNKETGLIRLGCICETSSARQEMRWDPIYEPFLHSFFKLLKCFSVNPCLWELFIQLNLVENWLTKFAYWCNVALWYNEYWDIVINFYNKVNTSVSTLVRVNNASSSKHWWTVSNKCRCLTITCSNHLYQSFLWYTRKTLLYGSAV